MAQIGRTPFGLLLRASSSIGAYIHRHSSCQQESLLICPAFAMHSSYIIREPNRTPTDGSPSRLRIELMRRNRKRTTPEERECRSNPSSPS